jgi:hypothetical protein
MKGYMLAASLVFSINLACSSDGLSTVQSDPATDRHATPTSTPEETGDPKPTQAPDPGKKDEPSLADNLIGTWKHISIAKTPDGAREPLEYASISWTFQPDGSGSYVQTVRGVARGSGTSEFKWTISGNDIEIASVGRGSAVTYTVVHHSKNEMTWRNNTLGDYYIVERQQ